MEEEIKYSTLGKMYFTLKELTDFIRLKPTYLIIGAQKGGTTSLYRYLVRHPQIRPALHKEIHYFDLHFNKPIRWYLAHYPIDLRQRFSSHKNGRMRITGEATPYYLFHPLAPKRVAKVFPEMKLICMLRNPVARAYSHFTHNKRKGRENRRFEEAIESELNTMPVEIEKIAKNDCYYSPEHRHFSYLSRGIYIDQIKNWHNCFKKEKLLIIKSEDFFENTNTMMDKVFHFLGIKELSNFSYKVFNQQVYREEINKNTRQKISDFFRPYNERLYKYLGLEFDWT